MNISTSSWHYKFITNQYFGTRRREYCRYGDNLGGTTRTVCQYGRAIVSTALLGMLYGLLLGAIAGLAVVTFVMFVICPIYTLATLAIGAETIDHLMQLANSADGIKHWGEQMAVSGFIALHIEIITLAIMGIGMAVFAYKDRQHIKYNKRKDIASDSEIARAWYQQYTNKFCTLVNFIKET